MTYKSMQKATPRTIALVAHDGKKQELVEWASSHREFLRRQHLYATGTTGIVLERELQVTVNKLASGPFGGDQQIGAKIAEGEIDCLIFFWEPLTSHAHEADVRALLRLAVVWNVPVACNRATADFLVSSPLMDGEYRRQLPEVERYQERRRQELLV